MINVEEIHLAKHCIAFAIEKGAKAARASLSKCVMDGYTMLNGELDKVSHSADRSIYLYLFVDGRYGTFSTNRLEQNELEDFIIKAIEMVRMLGEDACRQLPAAERTAKDAITGKELELCDEEYHRMDSERRLDNASRLSRYQSIINEKNEDWSLISEECEYSDTIDDNYTVDSQGFEGRHTETAFTCFTEITIESKTGDKYSGHWWESSSKYNKLPIEDCGKKALERAIRQIGPKNRRSGRYKMIVDTTVATRLVSPIFTALNAASIQQKMSFLEGKLGSKVFPEELNIIDLSRSIGKAGSRLYDTEGVATTEAPVIENGIVSRYFVNTYMANKTGLKATIEDISRPCLLPFIKGKDCTSAEKELSLDELMCHCVNGILVTGFNGGNCNPVTGDFSFGIEGFAFSKGKITHPVKEMLITGNMMSLWNNIIAAGNDARECTRWQIPSLAFKDVSFSS